MRVCHEFDGNPSAEPCKECKDRYIIHAETAGRLSDDIYICCDTAAEAEFINETIEKTHRFRECRIRPGTNFILAPRRNEN